MAAKTRSGFLILPAVLFYSIFILIPVGFFFFPALAGGKDFFLRAARELAGSSMLPILGFTFYQALISALISVAAGFFGAWIFGRFDFPFKKILNALFMIPFIAPPVIAVTGIVLFFGNNGILNHILRMIFPSFKGVTILYSFSAVIAAHAMYNFPIAIRIMATGWKNIGENPALAARLAGDSRMRVFAKIILPRLWPSVLSSFMLIFLYCFTSFVFVLVLGGGVRFTTLEVETYRLIRSDPSSVQALLFALVSLITALASLIVLIKLQVRLSFTEDNPDQKLKPMKAASPFIKTLSILYLVFVFFVILSPYLSLALSSFTVTTPGSIPSLSLANYSGLLQRTAYADSGFLEALFQSLSLGLTSAFAAMVISLPAVAWLSKKKSAALEVFFQIPMAVSTLIFSYAFLLVFVFTGLEIFRGRFGIQIIHIIMCIPFCIRALLPAFTAISWSPFYAARSLGAGNKRAFLTGLWPQIRAAIPGAFIFCMILSLGELTAVLILGEGRIVTMPLYIYRLIGSYRFPAAGAASLSYLVLCLGFFIVSEKIFAKDHHAKDIL